MCTELYCKIPKQIIITLHMIQVQDENSYTGLQNKATVSVERNGSQQGEERRKGEECKKKKKGEKKRENEDKNKNPEGKKAKEMKSVKKREKICSGSPLRSLRATNTSIIPDA